MIQGDHFNFTSVSKSSIITILKATKVSKADGQNNLSGRFLKMEQNFYSELLVIYAISCKVAKLKPLYKKGSSTLPCNCRPISLLPPIFKVIEKVYS